MNTITRVSLATRLFSISALFIASFFVLAPVADASSVIRVDRQVSLTEEQVVEGDFYALAPTIAVSGDVTGDTHLFGGRVTANGPMASDTLMVALSAYVAGEVGDDVRILAGEVTIDGTIKGDLVVVARHLKVLSTASVEGDIVFFGQDLEVEGAVGKDVLGRMTLARINAPVAGDVNISVGALTLGDRAAIAGGVQYASERTLTRAQNASIGGEVVQNQTPSPTAKSYFRGLLELMLPLLFAALTWLLIFRSSLDKLSRFVTTSYLRSALIGSAVMIALPVVAALLLFTGLGALIGVILFAIYFVLVMLSLVAAGAVVGEALRLWLLPRQTFGAWWVLVGTSVLALLMAVPYGTFAVVFLIVITMGGLAERLYASLRN